MAKGGREKIKLESSAGTGHFYTTSKTSVLSLRRWRSWSLILLFASTLLTKNKA